jgi:transcriptional regulator GlxA family with amidase domain
MDAEIVVFEGFDELDAIAPYEVLANACRFAGEGSVRLVSLDGEGVTASGSPSSARDPNGEREPTVTASHGLRVGVDGVLGQSAPGFVVVPGGGWNDRDRPGAWTEAESGRLPAALADLSDVTLASVCTGGMLLAAAGLLDGVPAVTHHSALDDLRETAADVRDARVVDAGDVLTAGGITSGLDLAFHLVDREFGDEIADRVAREMEYDPSDDVLVV